MKLKIDEQMSELAHAFKNAVSQCGIDVKHDDYKVIQPFSDGQAIVITVDGSGENRKTHVEITDTVVVMRKKFGTLDVFE